MSCFTFDFFHDSRFTFHVLFFTAFLLDFDRFTGTDVGSFNAIAGIALITDYPRLLVPQFEDLGAYFNARATAYAESPDQLQVSP